MIQRDIENNNTCVRRNSKFSRSYYYYYGRSRDFKIVTWYISRTVNIVARQITATNGYTTEYMLICNSTVL